MTDQELSCTHSPGSSRERHKGVDVFVLHVVRVEAIGVKGPGVIPDQGVVVQVEQVDGAEGAHR